MPMDIKRLPLWARLAVLGGLIIIIGGAGFMIWNQSPAAAALRATPTASLPTPTPGIDLPEFQSGTPETGVERTTRLHTDIPEDRPRTKIIQYVVKPGDTAWSIANEFGLRPETILWGNEGLSYIAASLSISETLNILPTDGVLHTVREGDDWDRIELLYGVPMTNVVSYLPNNFPIEGPFDLTVGSQIIIPGGQGTVYWVDPGPQVVAGQGRNSPGYYSGPLVYLGSGTFIWPVAPPIVLNQDYWSGHPALDIDVYFRQPIFASDNGTVIFAGWSQAGYGNLVIVDHGNDFWTYYAHLEAILVSEGQGVLQGQQLGEGGTTGNSTGYHLDFRVRYKAGNFHNPMLYLPPAP